MHEACPEAIKEPKFSPMRVLKSKLEGLKNYEFDDEITLIIKARVSSVGETYDKKDVEYTIQPVDCAIVEKGKHKVMAEMGIDKDRYNKLKKKGMIKED